MVTFNTVERKQHRLADGLGEDTIGGPSHSEVGVRSGKTMGLSGLTQAFLQVVKVAHVSEVWELCCYPQMQHCYWPEMWGGTTAMVMEQSRERGSPGWPDEGSSQE